MRRLALVATLSVLPATAWAVEPVKVMPERALLPSEDPVEVVLTCDTPGATILYTLDGSNPRTSPTAVSVSSGATVTISPPTSGVPGVVLRASATAELEPPSEIAAHSYIFLPRVLVQPATLPGWENYDYTGNGGPATHDYEMDPAVVDDPDYASEMVAALTEIPTMSLSLEPSEVWGVYRGDLEVMASLEVLFPEGDSEDTTCGVERHSHDRVKNSLRLSFKTEYEDPKWSTDLLQRGPLNGDSATDKLDRLVLRGGNNRSWARNWNPDRTTYTTDQWIRDTSIALSGYGSHGTFVHLYINGVYFGLYNPAERLDEWFTSAYYGGSEDDWFAISHSGPKGGDPARFDELTGPIKNLDMSDYANYQQLAEYLDVDLFSDYLLVHWYAGVRDWPQNNWWGGNQNLPVGPFKYFTWDGEWSFGVGQGSPSQPEVHPDFLAGVGKNAGPTSAQLFNSAKDSEEFLIAFADRAYRALYNDGALRDVHARARWQTLNEHLRTPVVAESARWGDAVVGGPTRTRDVDWQAEVDFQDAYMDGGAATFVSALRAEGYYPLEDPPSFFEAGELIEVTQMTLDEMQSLSVTVALTGEEGTVYYTLDGSDPRAVGGEPAGEAGGDSIDLSLEAPLVLKARTLDGNDWSALHVLELDEPSVGDGDGDGDGDGGETAEAGEGEGSAPDATGSGSEDESGSPGGAEASGGGCSCTTSREPAGSSICLFFLMAGLRRRASFSRWRVGRRGPSSLEA